MKKRTLLAIRGLFELEHTRGVMSGAELSDRLEVYPRKLYHITTPLVVAGLVKSIKGSGGGHELVRRGRATLEDVVRAFGESFPSSGLQLPRDVPGVCNCLAQLIPSMSPKVKIKSLKLKVIDINARDLALAIRGATWGMQEVSLNKLGKSHTGKSCAVVALKKSASPSLFGIPGPWVRSYGAKTLFEARLCEVWPTRIKIAIPWPAGRDTYFEIAKTDIQSIYL